MKKVVIIGPESTGKSTLCQQLAMNYQTLWCPEYAREYLLKHGTDYTFEDLLTIANGQVALEETYLEAAGKLSRNDSGNTRQRLLFIDTDMYVMKVWAEFVFGKCHLPILEAIAERHYDLYLLCKTDLPWVKDELREYPAEEPRKILYQIYKDILINQSVPWVEIGGNYDERLSKAIKAVDEIIM